MARVEGWRLVRHPFFLAFAALSLTINVVFVVERGGPDNNGWYDVLAGIPFMFIPLAFGALLAASLGASRSRYDHTDELYESAPVDASKRTAAHLTAVVWAGLLAVGWIMVGAVVSRMWNGLPVALLNDAPAQRVDYPFGTVIKPTAVVPSIFELAQSPLAIIVLGVLGVALARWLGTRLALLAVPVAFIAQSIITSWGAEGAWRWFLPFAHSLQGVGWINTSASGEGYEVVQGFNVAAMGWHDLYLIGAILILGTAALLRDRRDRLMIALAAFGGTLAVIGGVAQVLTYTESL